MPEEKTPWGYAAERFQPRFKVKLQGEETILDPVSLGLTSLLYAVEVGYRWAAFYRKQDYLIKDMYVYSTYHDGYVWQSIGSSAAHFNLPEAAPGCSCRGAYGATKDVLQHAPECLMALWELTYKVYTHPVGEKASKGYSAQDFCERWRQSLKFLNYGSLPVNTWELAQLIPMINAYANHVHYYCTVEQTLNYKPPR